MRLGQARNRREQLCAAAGLALLAVAAYLTRAGHGPTRDLVLAEACRTPVRVLEPRGARRIGSAVVFHGLSANRIMMQTTGQWLSALGLRVYLADSPGHGDSDQPFSYGRAEQCAAMLVEGLRQSGELAPERTVLAGHSLGGATAVRLADQFPAAATLAISPAPLNLPRRMPANLLIVSAQFDMTMMKETARKLVQAAGGERTALADFPERRAVRWVEMRPATHTSLVFDPRVARLLSTWVSKALGEAPPQRIPSPGWPVAGSVIGLVSLLLMFPLAASSLASWLTAGEASMTGLAAPAAGAVLGRWVVAALLSASALSFWVPLRALHILTGDYVGSFLLLAGLALLALLWEKARGAVRLNARALVVAGTLALASSVAFGLWLNWQLTDAWPTAARWMRVVPLALACCPYLLAEAVALGPPRADRAAASQAAGGNVWPRFALFFVLRLVLLLALALVAFGSGQILVLLLALYLALFSVFERLGADAVWRRTGSAAAAALFGAILAGWFVAAVFPLS